MLSGCAGENMNTFLIMVRSTEERQAFLSTLCKIIRNLFIFLPLLMAVCCSLRRRKDRADSGVS